MRRTFAVKSIISVLILASVMLYGCGKSSDAGNPSSSDSTANTSTMSVTKTANGAQVLSLSDACESLSNIIIPESTDATVTGAQGSTHFISSKPSCSTQSEGKCQCT